MTAPRILLLGGTSEARALAAALVADGVPVTSSLAGRVSEPRLPVGDVRIGGFGGVAGLAAALQGYDAVVDATHPFAETMTIHAHRACQGPAARPLLRLQRPGWGDRAPDGWHWADTHEEAAELAAELGQRPVLTIGRQRLAAFVSALHDRPVLTRVVEAPEFDLPPRWTVRYDRGPYALDGERDLLLGHDADVLVTKDSGGDYTWPKLLAADELGLSVIVVRRPPVPGGMTVVDDVADALDWVRSLAARERP